MVRAFAQGRNSTTSIFSLGFCPEAEPQESRRKDFDMILKLDCILLQCKLHCGLSVFPGAHGLSAGGQDTLWPYLQGGENERWKISPVSLVLHSSSLESSLSFSSREFGSAPWSGSRSLRRSKSEAAPLGIPTSGRGEGLVQPRQRCPFPVYLPVCLCL